MPRSTPSNDTSHACYSPRVLAVYDAWVLGFSNRWLWRCPTKRLLAHYDEHVTENHLDVGVGTGYFLDRCRFPTEPRIVLLDANSHALARTAQRIARHRPEVLCCNLLEPLTCKLDPFDSISFNYVWHCLPGGAGAKAAVFGRLAALLRPGGVLFGATLLPSGASGFAKALMHHYNRRGIFANEEDTEESLRAALESHFVAVSIERVGSAALFTARLPAAQRA